MECEQVRPVLMDYLLEEISPSNAEDIQRHLEQCAGCSQEAGKFRQTLALVRQTNRMEEIPERIRLAPQPAGRWHALWLNPARLAVAGFALACLAIALLSVSHATVSLGQGGVRIAFGPAAAPVASHAAEVQTAGAPALTREQIIQLVSEAVSASEAKQQGDVKQLIANVSEQNEQQRMRDWRDLTESLRPLEAAQVTIWKQQMQSDQYVSQLMQQAGMTNSAR